MDFQKTMDVMTEIENERRRQVTHEGWSLSHDDQHSNGEMAKAAAVYAWFASLPSEVRDVVGATHGSETAVILRRLWPWWFDNGDRVYGPAWWKPKSPRRDLIRAAALLVAEIERMDRAAARTGDNNMGW